MPKLLAFFNDLLERLLTRETLTEIAAVLVTFGLAWLIARAVRDWLEKHQVAAPETTRERLAEGFLKITPFVITTILLALARGILDRFGLHTEFMDLMLRLMVALVLVRIAVFMLRLSLGPRTWVKGWETRLTLIIWIVVAIDMLGWFEPVVDKLDSIKFVIGRKSVTVWSVLESVFTITLFVLGATWIAHWIERRVMSLPGLAASARIGISKFTHVLLISLSILIGLSVAGLDITVLTVLGGAIGIGLGFGLQAIASNFVSGFVLLMDRSIKPGDVISFTGVGGTSTEGFGWVQELRGRYIVVRDRDGVETLVPNQNLITNSVINWSYTDPKVRLKLPVRISYADDPEVALRVLITAAEGQRRILRDPAPVSRLIAFTDYGMDLELRFWIADPQEGVNNIRSEVNRAIWRLFKEHGITMPVSQHEVRMLRTTAEDADQWAFSARPERRE